MTMSREQVEAFEAQLPPETAVVEEGCATALASLPVEARGYVVGKLVGIIFGGPIARAFTEACLAEAERQRATPGGRN